MNYILVVDDEADIRDIYEMVLDRAYPIDTVTARSGREALEVIEKRGRPEIVISDLNMPDGDGHFLYLALKEKNLTVPFVICSTDNKLFLKKKFPDIHAFIEKPNVITPVLEAVDSVVARFKEPPQYIPVRITQLLRRGSSDFDLYLQLSRQKYVKVINAHEAFLPSDAERFKQKGLDHLLITAEDSETFLRNFEDSISVMMNSEQEEHSDLSVFSMDALRTVERIAASLGWTPQVLEAAKKAVGIAIKSVSQEVNLLKLLRQKLNNPQSHYSSHVTMLSILTCGVSYQLGWTSDSTQMKLGLASLMHDLTVDESIYDEILMWNEAAVDPNVKTPEVVKYRNHPADAANLVQTMKNLPADVDQIILQHHERKDGSGFPRGLVSSRITPMASVFIIVEDLINHLGDSDDIEKKIDHFMLHREKVYNSGNFKKVFEAFKSSVDKARH